MSDRIDVVTRRELATLRWLALPEGQSDEVKLAAWLELKEAEEAQDAQEREHQRQMLLSTSSGRRRIAEQAKNEE